FCGAPGLVVAASTPRYGGAWDGMTPEDLDSITTEHFSSSADASSPYVDHLEADLAGLPPVFIAAAGLDPLRDDSEALHVRLEDAGTPVDYHLYPGVLHSFLHFGRMLDDAGDVLTRSAGFAAAHLCTAAEGLRQQWPGLPESRGRAIRSWTSVVSWWVTCRKRLVLPLIDQLVLVFFVDRIGTGLLRQIVPGLLRHPVRGLLVLLA